MKKLSSAQKAALENLASGLPSNKGLFGRSAMGGHVCTMVSLYHAGLVDGDHAITDAGRAAIAPRPSDSKPSPLGD